jgi:hypothetical protein
MAAHERAKHHGILLPEAFELRGDMGGGGGEGDFGQVLEPVVLDVRQDAICPPCFRSSERLLVKAVQCRLCCKGSLCYCQEDRYSNWPDNRQPPEDRSGNPTRASR